MDERMKVQRKYTSYLSIAFVFVGLMILYGLGESITIVFMMGPSLIFLVVYQLFLGKVPDVMFQSVHYYHKKKQSIPFRHLLFASTVYCVAASLVGMGILAIIANTWLLQYQDYYAQSYLQIYILVLPVLALVQLLRGILQVKFDEQIVTISYVVQAVFSVLIMALSFEAWKSYGEQIGILLLDDKLPWFYASFSMVTGIIVGAILTIVANCIMIGLYKIRNIKSSSKGEGFHQNIGRTALILAKRMIHTSINDCFKYMLAIIVFYMGLRDVTSGNMLVGHLFGMMIPFVGILIMASKIIFQKSESRMLYFLQKRLKKEFVLEVESSLLFSTLIAFFMTAMVTALSAAISGLWGLGADDAVKNLFLSCSVYVFFYCLISNIEKILKLRHAINGILVASMIALVPIILLQVIWGESWELNGIHTGILTGIYGGTNILVLIFILKINVPILWDRLKSKMLMMFVGGAVLVLLSWLIGTALFTAIGAIASMITLLILLAASLFGLIYAFKI